MIDLVLVLFVPTGVLIPFHHLLVGPVAGLVAVGAALIPVLGLDPAGVGLSRLFPAPGGPGPAIVLAIPVAIDPDVVPVRPGRPLFHPGSGRGIRCNADADWPEI